MSPKSHARMVTVNRWVETAAFAGGAFILLSWGMSELFLHAYCHVRPCLAVEQATPWGLILSGVMLVLPKTFGRTNATGIVKAGIEAITLRLRGAGAASATVTAQAAGQPERPVATVQTPPSGGEASVTVPGPGTPGPAVPVEPDHPDGVEEGTVPVTGLPLTDAGHSTSIRAELLQRELPASLEPGHPEEWKDDREDGVV